jgi:hypothetical protein
MPFGPEISWPQGFRQFDPQSRDVLESAYDTGSVYQQPAMDEYGYGDPGYADPSYDGPKTPHADPAFRGGTGSRRPSGPAAPAWSSYRPPWTAVPGYQVPDFRDTSRPGYAGPGYAGPGPQSPARRWAAEDSGGPAATGSSADPEQWYGNPRLDDRVLGDGVRGHGALDGSRPADQRPVGARPADPRLEGMRYDELRYDEPSADEPSGDRGFDGSFDDESWYQELRRGGSPYLQTPDDQPFPAGPASRAEPGAPWPGPQPGYPRAPAADWFTGRGPGRGDQGDRGGSAAGRATSAGPRPGGQPEPGSGLRMGTPAGAGSGRQPAVAFRPVLTGQESGFLSAPAAQVGVLTPPAGSRVDAQPESGSQLASPFLAPPSEGRAAAPGRAAAQVRPGHGLDGPEITSSWPAAPQADELESFAEFWREDDQDGDDAGLFGDRVVNPDDARPAAKRRIGRRRGGSNDHRLWLALGGVVVVAAATITGIIKFEFPSHGGPAHTMVTPDTIGTFVRTVDLERQTNVAQLRDEVITMSSGHASRVVSAVYESGNSAAGNDEQIIMFIGGHLANAAPAASVASFTQKFGGAEVVSAGSLGGKAACVEEGSSSDGVSMCAWFDNDSFGEIVSPTMNATALAKEMLTVRPSVEMVVKN